MSAAVAAAAAAAARANRRSSSTSTTKKINYAPSSYYQFSFSPSPLCHSRYEIIKRQDWNNFVHYLKNHHHHAHGQPPLSVRRCSGSHVLGYLKYLDQFGETKVHNMGCKYYGQAYSSVACSCPLKEAWSSLEGVVGRLRAAFEQHGGSPETNPFGSPVVWLYLKEVKVFQAKARGLIT